MSDSNTSAGACLRALLLTIVFLGLYCGTANAHAEIVQGRLELIWGDANPTLLKRGAAAVRMEVTLVDDFGRRYPLDPAQAQRAAHDLHGLTNRRVAVQFSSGAKSGARRKVEVIVPADGLGQGVHGGKLAEAGPAGPIKWITLLCKFSDSTWEPRSYGSINALSGNNPGQLGHYWNEASYGKISLDGSTTHGWFTLPETHAYYTTGNFDKPRLAAACIAAADPTVDFTGVYGLNLLFNGDLGGYAWGGSACYTMEGSWQCHSTTWMPPWGYYNTAPLAHEMGHGYGLAHSNNSDGDGDTYDNTWDVMSEYWYNVVTISGNGTVPKHMSMRQRDRLGWVEPARKLTVGSGKSLRPFTLDRANLAGSTNPQMVVLELPKADAKGMVYYTLEVRTRNGSYDGNLPGNAVIIHGVNSSGTNFSIDADTPPANRSNNEGSMFKTGETWISPDGTQRVKIGNATADGFIITIGSPRFTGGNQLPRVRTGTSAAASMSSTSTSTSTTPERRVAPPTAQDCRAGGEVAAVPVRCFFSER